MGAVFDMDIIFNGTSCPIKYLHIGVQGNNLVDKIVFCVQRKTDDGLDLSEFTPYVKIQNAKENYIDKDGKLSTDKTDDQLRLTYRLRRKTTMYPCFEMQLQFEHPGEGDCIVWQTEVINVTLSRTIAADKEIEQQYPSVIQNLTERVEQIESVKIINGGQP